MKRKDFWVLVEREANFMIDKHEELVRTMGQKEADDGLEQAITASNLLVRMQQKTTLTEKINHAIHHVAFACVALWLDMKAAGVDNVVTVLMPQKDENGEEIK